MRGFMKWRRGRERRARKRAQARSMVLKLYLFRPPGWGVRRWGQLRRSFGRWRGWHEQFMMKGIQIPLTPVPAYRDVSVMSTYERA